MATRPSNWLHRLLAQELAASERMMQQFLTRDLFVREAKTARPTKGADHGEATE